MDGKFLEKILRFLVDEYGAQAVQDRLSFVLGRSEVILEVKGPHNLNDKEKRKNKKRSNSFNMQKKKKLLPVDYVNMIDIGTDVEFYARKLAKDFQEKIFLPTVSDVRNFVETRKSNEYFNNIDIHNIKSRQSAIPRLFRYICSLSKNEIEDIINNPNNYGPSSMRSLSEAIRVSGEQRRKGNFDH
jgi:hypothetical protein